MKKKVLLLAVSCKNGGLCPGGLDLSNPEKWIRIVSDDGNAGSVQGYEIDFAEPLDIIEFEGRPMPQGKQQENWVIDNDSCKNLGRGSFRGDSSDKTLAAWAYRNYEYHGFWNNYKAYLTEDEFEHVTSPSESILKVTDVRIYKNNFDKAKIDFNWNRARYRIQSISLTDQDFYDQIDGEEVTFDEAYIVISIPKEVGDFINPNTGDRQAYKFVSKVFGLDD